MLRCLYCSSAFFSFFIWYFDVSLSISSQFITNAKEITLNKSTISIYDYKHPSQKHYELMNITLFSMPRNQKDLKNCGGIVCTSPEIKQFSRPQHSSTDQNITYNLKRNLNTTLSTSFMNQTRRPARHLYVKNPNYEEFYIDVSTTNDAIFSEFQLEEKNSKKATHPLHHSNTVYEMKKKPFTESSTVDSGSNKDDETLAYKKSTESDKKPSPKSPKKTSRENHLPLSTTSLYLKKKGPQLNKTSTKLPKKSQAQKIETKQQGTRANNILVTTDLPPSVREEKHHIQGMEMDLLPSLDHSNTTHRNKKTSDSVHQVVKSGDNPDILSKTLDKDSVIDIDPPLLHASSSTKEGQWQPNEMLSNTEQEETSLEETPVTNEISTLPKGNDQDKFNFFMSADKFKQLFYKFLSNMTPTDIASFFSDLSEKNATLHEKRVEETNKTGNNTVELLEDNTPESTLLSSTNMTSIENIIEDEPAFTSGNTYEINALDRDIFDNDFGHRERKENVNITEYLSKDFSVLYEDDSTIEKLIGEGKKPIHNNIFEASQATTNQSRVNSSTFRTPRETVLKISKNDKLSSKSETPQSALKVNVKNFVIDTQEIKPNQSLAETSINHGLLHANNVLKFPSSTSLSSADACSLVISFGRYDKKHVCCSQQNGIWWDAKVWSCKRTPSHQDVAVVLHRIELFNANSTNVHIILNGLYILSTKSQQGSLSGGLPLWEICKTHLMSYAQNPSYQPQMYRYPWTFYNESLNEEFYDFFQKTLTIQEICLEFLGSHATHYRQSAKIYLVGQSVFCPSTPYLHNIQTNEETSSREFSIQSLLFHQCINKTSVLGSSRKPSTLSKKSQHKSLQPPQLVVGEHSALLLFTNISIIMGDQGVIQNSGTLFVGPSFIRRCGIVAKTLSNPVNQCAISSILLFEGVSLLAYRPIRVARLEINSFQTFHLNEQRNLQPQGKWMGSVGYPSWLPSADLSALIIHHGIQQLEELGDYTFFFFKQLFIPGQSKETIVTFCVNKLQDTHVRSISFFVDIIISGNTLYQTQLIFNNISVKFSRYFEETLQIWGDISISAESASIDRKVSHASSIQVKKPHLQHSLLRLMCTFFCDLNNKIYYGDAQERVQVVTRLS